jgi:hypothetical protein
MIRYPEEEIEERLRSSKARLDKKVRHRNLVAERNEEDGLSADMGSISPEAADLIRYLTELYLE